jgi:hypothetical protein
MALLQSSLAEDNILSRQERAVIRGIHRASQLSEAIVMLQKSRIVLLTEEKIPLGKLTQEVNNNVELMIAYLKRQASTALVNTKVPADSSDERIHPIEQRL